MLKNAVWLFVIALFVLFAFLPSYTQMQDLRLKNDQYSQEIVRLKRERAQLLREKKLLLSDPVYLEKVAREKMGLIKEGEVIYKITPARKDGKVISGRVPTAYSVPTPKSGAAR